MPNAVAQLCQVIAKKLQEQPEITQADLIAQVEAAIAQYSYQAHHKLL